MHVYTSLDTHEQTLSNWESTKHTRRHSKRKPLTTVSANNVLIMNTPCSIESIDFKNNADEARAIRKQVFIDEQHVPEAEEWDEHDREPSTIHLIARNSENKAVGYVRVVFLPGEQTKITRLAVLLPFRKGGVGSALLRAALKRALSRPYSYIFLHAQLSALPLYESMGFQVQGNQFIEAGIVHQKLAFNAQNPKNIENIFAEDVLRLDNAVDFTHHIQQCISLSRRKLRISSINLHKDIFENETFIDVVSNFARQHRNAQVNILVQEPNIDQLSSSALVALAQRLPSKIQIKVLNKDAEKIDSFVCADKHYLVFFNDERYTNGFCCYRAKLESQSCQDAFERVWNYSAHSDPNLAQLNI